MNKKIFTNLIGKIGIGFKSVSIILVPILVFIIPFSVYLYTLSPSVAPGDSTEMVTAAITLGVPHQPSYPVNIFLGHILSKVPIPMSQVFKINAVSALFQALAVLVMYFVILEFYLFVRKGKKLNIGLRLIAMCSVMFLAFSLIYWQYATKFEVFPLNNLFSVIIIYLAARYSFRDKTLSKQQRRELFKGTLKLKKINNTLLLLSLFGGLALAHHQTVVLIIPAVLFLMWKKVIKLLTDKNLIINIPLSILAFIVGVLPFFLLIIAMASKNPAMNWGDIKGFDGALNALLRRDFGTFSSYLVGFEQTIRTTPIDQIFFYLKNLLNDFSVVGIVLIILGLVFLWRRKRQVFYFSFLGVFVSGFFFLSIANFPLLDSFNQATVRRFHMLPNIFITLVLSFGLYFLYQQIEEVEQRQVKWKMGLNLAKAYLCLLFVFSLFMNFGKASNRGNTLTLTYTNHSFAKTPDNALIMLSGDIPNMTVDYYRFAKLREKDNRTTFTPGQFHLDWFIPQLTKRYPDLLIPKPKDGKLFTTTTQIIDANFGKRPIYVGPDLVVHDPELEQKYVLYPTNLLFLVKRKGEDLKLEEWREENDKLFGEIDLDLMKDILRKTPTFEETIVFHYSRHFYNVGFVYEEVGLYEDAIREYQRVLEINPFFKEALASLGRVYGSKLDPPDYIQAIEYLRNYQSVLEEGEFELGQAAQSLMYEFQQKYAEEVQEQAEFEEAVEQNQATPSSETVIEE